MWWEAVRQKLWTLRIVRQLETWVVSKAVIIQQPVAGVAASLKAAGNEAWIETGGAHEWTPTLHLETGKTKQTGQDYNTTPIYIA